MASELQTRWATGATIKCDVRPLNGGSQVGDVTLSESSGYYYGDFPSASAGHHMLIYYDTATGNVIAQHAVYWTGSAIAGPPTADGVADEVETRALDVGAISGDSAAADALEAILDGTGARLTLASSDNSYAALRIIGASSGGPGVTIAGGTGASGVNGGHGVQIQGGGGDSSDGGNAVILFGGPGDGSGKTSGYGLAIAGGNGTASAASTAALAMLLGDLSASLDGIKTLDEAIRVILAALAGKASGLDTNSPVYRDIADTKNRISATTDADGNRSAVTLDAT